MHSPRSHPSMFGTRWSPTKAALVILLTLLLFGLLIFFINLTAQPAQGQTYKVIYNFAGGTDGAGPDAGLTMDSAGNLYGTTGGGGYQQGSCSPGGCGTVFKLSPHGSEWIFTPLYNFKGDDDGWCPEAVPTIGPDGNLYGTTTDGSPGGSPAQPSQRPMDDTCSGGFPCGTIYRLAPPARTSANALGGWTHTVLHHFQGYPTDGNQPYHSPVTFDPQGAFFLTTYMGGDIGPGGGTVIQMTPLQGGWSETLVYSIGDGSYPVSGVVLDASGNIYGTTLYGGWGDGVVFELTSSDGVWSETVLHYFESQGDGGFPMGGLILDPAGYLYGTTSGGNYPYPDPTVFEVTKSEGNWILNTLYSFPALDNSPIAGVARDAAGNLYGTAYSIGGGGGLVFKLSPGENGWTYTTLYDFPDCHLGCQPRGGVVVDASGNIYSTAQGGLYGGGVVFEITP